MAFPRGLADNAAMKKTILLGVNIDHSATLRQARYREYPRTCGQMVEPDPLALALAAEQAGADGITVHLREDRRHIQERDVQRLRDLGRYGAVIGKAYYAGTLDLAQAMEAAGPQDAP